MTEDKIIEALRDWVEYNWSVVDAVNAVNENGNEKFEIGYGDLVEKFGKRLYEKMKEKMRTGELLDSIEGLREVVKRFDMD